MADTYEISAEDLEFFSQFLMKEGVEEHDINLDNQELESV